MGYDYRTDRVCAAHHEAAHTVMTYWFGGWLNEDGVEIDARQYTGARWRLLDYTFEANIIMSMAGKLAEAKYLGVRGVGFGKEALWILETVRNGDEDQGSDEEQIATLLLQDNLEISDVDYIKAVRRYEIKTRRLLNKPPIWRAVETVAAALLKSGRLTNDEAMAMIDKDFWEAMTPTKH